MCFYQPTTAAALMLLSRWYEMNHSFVDDSYYVVEIKEKVFGVRPPPRRPFIYRDGASCIHLDMH